MPKMKSHRGAAKRFKVTGTGKIKRGRAFRKHLFEKKPSTRTRRLKPQQVISPADEPGTRRLLGM
jgi:large subunit ribosomal protein L35